MRPATPLLIALLLALLCTAVRAQDNSTITPPAAGNGTLTEAPVQPCVQSANLVIAPVGANCSNASLPAGSGIVCERGSLCRNCNGANCSSDLVCIARPRINEPCTNPADLPCFHPTFGGIECVSGTCRFANVFGAGETCFDSEVAFANGGCLNGLSCTNGTCGTRLALNASCDTTADACGPGLFCSAANGSTCVARLSEGAACEGDHQCAATLICSDRGLKNGTFCFPRFQLPTGSPCTKLGDCAADNFCTLGVCRSVALAQNCTGAEATPQCNADTTCTCTASGDRKCIGSFFTADQIAADQAFRACLVQNQCLLPELAGGLILGFGPRACWATNCCAQVAAFFNVTATDNCVFATPPPTATTEAPAPTTAAPAPTTAAPAPTTAAPTPAPTTAAPAPTTAAPTPSTQAPTPAPTTQAPAPQASATSAAVLTTGVTATSSGGASTSSVATTSGGATSAAATTSGGGASTGNPGSFTGGVQFPANAASAALPSALLAIGLGAAALLVAV